MTTGALAVGIRRGMLCKGQLIKKVHLPVTGNLISHVIGVTRTPFDAWKEEHADITANFTEIHRSKCFRSFQYGVILTARSQELLPRRRGIRRLSKEKKSEILLTMMVLLTRKECCWLTIFEVI